MEIERKRELQATGMKIREKALETIQVPNSGHIGGSFSVADLLAVLYFKEMQIDPEKPEDENRDRFVLSKGHCSPALYATLALRGYFPLERLQTFRSAKGDLSGHVEMTKVPGVDMSTGSLGQGLSAAVGMALSEKMFHKNYYTYVVTGDGEIQEGQIWEAAMAAANYCLDHLILFVDNNRLQIDGSLEEVMSPYPIDEKFRAFGWNTLTIDGHDPEAIHRAVMEAKSFQGKPTAIIAETIKGKGVSFMENRAEWHGKTPDEKQYAQAFAELKEERLRLEVQ